MEEVGRGLCVTVVEGVDERLRGTGRAATAPQQQEAADGEDTDAGAADAEHLPPGQSGDDLVVTRLTVLPLLLVPLLGLAVLSLWLPLLGLSLLWRRLPALWPSALTLAGLATLWLSALALSRLPTLWLALAGLPTLGLSLSRLPALWLSTLCTLLGLSARLATLLGLPALLWLAAVLVAPLVAE